MQRLKFGVEPKLELPNFIEIAVVNGQKAAMTLKQLAFNDSTLCDYQ